MPPVTLSKGIKSDWDLGESWKSTGGDSNWRHLNAFALDQWAHDKDTTTGLTYGHRGGVVIDADGVVTVIPGGTVALTDAATNYVERNALGAVSANTSEFTPGAFPMAIVPTAGGVIDANAIVDCRVLASQLPAGAATEEYVDNAIDALKAGVSTSFDTLAEIATELGSLDTRMDVVESAVSAGRPFAIAAAFGDGLTVPSANAIGGIITLPVTATIIRSDIDADVSGDAVVNWYRAPAADPTNFTSVVASAKPTLSSQQSATDSTLTGWTVSLSAGDRLKPVLESVAICKLVTSTLRLTT